MPRGNPNIWKSTGSSFADLSAQTGPSTSAASASSPFPEPAHKAGVPSTQRPRGAGSFQAQSSWGLAAPGASTSLHTATEAKTQFRPPPDGLVRATPYSHAGTFPHPNYPHDRKTLNQINFNAESVSGVQRTAPVRPKDTPGLLPADVPPQYGTAYGSTFRGGAHASSAGPRAGNPAAQPPGYNIITGGTALGNNRFEYFDQSRDYKRHR